MIGLTGNLSRGAPAAIAGRTARQREADAEDARWEMQIRKMTRHSVRAADPAVAPRPAPVRTALHIVSKVRRHDMLLIPRVLPIAAGGEPQDLVCGKCAKVIASGTSPASVRRLHPEGDTLIVRCPCGALNLLCGIAGVRSGYR